MEGTAFGFSDDTQVFVYKVSDNNQPEIIDTLIIKNEKFLGSYPKTEAIAIHYLRVGQLKNTILYFPENVDLKVALFKDSIQSSYITGGAQNDAYKVFLEKIRGFNKEKQENMKEYKQARLEQDGMLVSEIRTKNVSLVNEENNFKKQFITENNNSLFSVLLMTEMVNRKEITHSEVNSIIKNLSPKVAATNSTKNLKIVIASMKKADVGGIAPDFSAPTPEGKMLSLNEVMGKYTIIDFWASWCKPCRRENPNVVKVYNKYHDKGLNIISVSLDKEKQKDRWIKAIEDDNLTWSHVSNLKFWSDPIAKMYNVRAIPATFLLDEKGEIIAKDLRGIALEKKIATLLGE